MSSRSGAFQSKILRYVIRQAQRFADQAAIARRRWQVAATWGAQILLYPVYAAVQTGQILSAEVRQAVKLVTSDFASPVAPSTATLEIVTAETPIQQALLTIEQFSLPAGLVVLRSQPAPQVTTTPAQIGWWQRLNQWVVRQPAAIATRDSTATTDSETLELQSHVSQAAIVDASLAQPAIVSIQGIANLIATRSLVLVTNQNEILDILTAAQQTKLRQAIIWAVASYGRSRHLEQTMPPLLHQAQTLVKASQQLQTKAQQMIRFILFLLAVLWQTGRRTVGRVVQSKTPVVAAAANSIAELPGTAALTTDLPIQQALQMVAQFALPERVLIRLLPGEGNRLAIAPVSSPAITDSTNPGTLQSVAPRQQSAKPAIVIQGIASCLETRSLVLVTQQNQILDILTTAQQNQLRQRITWDVANLGREQKLRQASVPTLESIAATANEKKLLLPILVLQRVMAWMERSSVAIALNLFQEASLVPAIADSTCAIDLDFFSLAPPQISQRDSALATVPTASVIAQLDTNDLTSASSADYIETSVTLLRYEQSPFEKLLRWLDRCLVWLEDWIGHFWHGAK